MLKKQTNIAKDQFKLLKDHQNNVINNNREDHEVKAEDDKAEDDVRYCYIGDEYKNLIDRLIKNELMFGELRLTNFDNQELALTNIMKNCLRLKIIDVDNKLFNFDKSIKHLAKIDDKINMIVENYKHKTKIEYNDKKELLVH